MSDIETLQEILRGLPASDLTYQEWLYIGAVCKRCGLSCDDWDAWSALDDRHRGKDCIKRWNTLPTALSIKTAVYIAKQHGLRVSQDFSFEVSARASMPPKYPHYRQEVESEADRQEFCRLLDERRALYSGIDFADLLSIDPNSMHRFHDGQGENGAPINHGAMPYSEGIASGRKYIGLNALKDGATDCKESSVKEYKYLVIEADHTPLMSFYKAVLSMRLPFIYMLYTGNKSLHTVVKVDAHSLEEFRAAFERIRAAFSALAHISIDTSFASPTQTTRLPNIPHSETGVPSCIFDVGMCDGSFDTWFPDMMTTADIIKMPPLSYNWVIKDYIESEGVCAMVGAPKVGKTWLSLIVAMSLASGGRVPCIDGLFDVGPDSVNVLYVGFETSLTTFQRRVISIAEDYGLDASDEALERIYFMDRSKWPAKSLDAIYPEIVQRARFVHAGLVIIDPLFYTYPAEGKFDENSNGDMGGLVARYRDMQADTGAAVLLVHHTPKCSAGRDITDSSAGAGAFMRAVNSALVVTKADPSKVKTSEGAPVKLADNERLLTVRVIAREAETSNTLEDGVHVVAAYPSMHLLSGTRKISKQEAAGKTQAADTLKQYQNAYNALTKAGETPCLERMSQMMCLDKKSIRKTITRHAKDKDWEFLQEIR